MNGEEQINKRNTNYKRWSFRLMVYSVITYASILYFYFKNSTGLHHSELLFNLLAVIFLMALLLQGLGYVFFRLSIKNHEAQDYQLRVLRWGYPLLFALSLLLFYLGFSVF